MYESIPNFLVPLCLTQEVSFPLLSYYSLLYTQIPKVLSTLQYCYKHYYSTHQLSALRGSVLGVGAVVRQCTSE